MKYVGISRVQRESTGKILNRTFPLSDLVVSRTSVEKCFQVFRIDPKTRSVILNRVTKNERKQSIVLIIVVLKLDQNYQPFKKDRQ